VTLKESPALTLTSLYFVYAAVSYYCFTMNIKETMKILIIFLISIQLTSCVSVRNVSYDYKLNAGEGLAIFSITASGDCGTPYFGQIRNVNTKKTYSINLSSADKTNDWFKNANDCSNKPNQYYGRVVVLALPAGMYEVYQFEGINEYRKLYIDREISIRFNVVEHTNNYIGNFHFDIVGRKLRFYHKNEAKRDLEVFRNKYINYGNKEVLMFDENNT
jgi:hypothetical protein